MYSRPVCGFYTGKSCNEARAPVHIQAVRLISDKEAIQAAFNHYTPQSKTFETRTGSNAYRASVKSYLLI